jgi:hypothetical protein
LLEAVIVYLAIILHQNNLERQHCMAVAPTERW